MLEVLEGDFRRIPELMGRVLEPEPAPAPLCEPQPETAVQLGLF